MWLIVTPKIAAYCNAAMLFRLFMLALAWYAPECNWEERRQIYGRTRSELLKRHICNCQRSVFLSLSSCLRSCTSDAQKPNPRHFLQKGFFIRSLWALLLYTRTNKRTKTLWHCDVYSWRKTSVAIWASLTFFRSTTIIYNTMRGINANASFGAFTKPKSSLWDSVTCQASSY